jgi:hypothetical protein
MQDRHARTVGGQSPKPAPILPSLPCSPIEEPADDPQMPYTCNREPDCRAWYAPRTYACHRGHRAVYVQGRGAGVARIERVHKL